MVLKAHTTEPSTGADYAAGITLGSTVLYAKPANHPAPTITISGSPLANLTAPANVTFSATATASGATIAHVDYYSGASTTPFATVTTGSSYTYKWTNIPAGAYQVTATATDSLGSTSARSNQVNFTVAAPRPPTVSLTSLDASLFQVGKPIAISATAVATTNPIARIDVSADGKVVSSCSNVTTCTAQWTPSAIGEHTATAIAIDSKNITGYGPTTRVGVISFAPPVRGGANIPFYNYVSAGCVKEPYGIIKSYNTTDLTHTYATVQANVKAKFASMYEAGQRSLRLVYLFDDAADNVSDGSVIGIAGGYDSLSNTTLSPGQISPTYKTNLLNVISDAHAAGFANIELGLFWIGGPTGSTYSSTSYPHYKAMLTWLVPAVFAQYPQLTIDLLNEGFPFQASIRTDAVSVALRTFVPTAWSDYLSICSSTTGNTSTWCASRATVSMVFGDYTDSWKIDSTHLGQMFPTIWPSQFEIHLYDMGQDSGNPGAILSALSSKLSSLGTNGASTQIEIGESWYNDSLLADAIRSSMIGGFSRRISSVIDWPTQRATNSCNGDISGFPLIFTNYYNDGL